MFMSCLSTDQNHFLGASGHRFWHTLFNSKFFRPSFEHGLVLLATLIKSAEKGERKAKDHREIISYSLCVNKVQCLLYFCLVVCLAGGSFPISFNTSLNSVLFVATG